MSNTEVSKMNCLAAEQRGINRNIHNCTKGQGINKPQSYETAVRHISGGLGLRRIQFELRFRIPEHRSL